MDARKVAGALAAIAAAGAVAAPAPVGAGGDTPLTAAQIGICEEAGEEYGICPELLEAIMERESGGQRYAANGSCKGLMQVSVRWHADRMARLGVSDPYDERGNVMVAADYLADLFAECDDPALVLMEYHGEGGARERARSGEASAYAEGILERSAQLERMHGK